jgi:hypothetical protein
LKIVSTAHPSYATTDDNIADHQLETADPSSTTSNFDIMGLEMSSVLNAQTDLV